ncbi:phosphoglycolate phosphatase [Fictibacillus macauensis ZFHKF-1]|uniref:Phosphoglycolate phosphatase n=1 Tax=Fictibacillus macauensis ZFHKF-1 TaxID=1196324 RepID=I8UBF3_9BACL|nr:HAD hydrolase-like protein [Fictibacillus macauensis]EIT84113.1 phosphoglycolate phosphatase [Fictibacillus macauensis ZFHKF-1]
MNILWDFDGTLMNTYPAYTDIMARVLGKEAQRDDIQKQLKVSFPHAMTYFQVTAEQEREIRSLCDQISPADVRPFAGVEKVLAFADQNVIMTHKNRQAVLDILRYHHLEHYFADMVTGDDGYPRKPHSASYAYLHNKHHIDLAIGDRELDLLPANNLGIATCSFQRNCSIATYEISDYEDFFQLEIVKKGEAL